MKLLARNALWLFSGQCLSVVIQASYFVALARLLGRVEYGVYISVTSLSAVLSQYSTLGSGFVLLSYVAINRDRIREFLGNLFLATVTAGPLTVLVLFLTGHVALRGVGTALLVFVGLSDCLLGAFVLSTAQAFQAFERMHVTAVLNVTTNALRLIVAIVLLTTVHTVSATVWAAGVLGVSSIAAMLSGFCAVRYLGKPEPHFRSMLSHAGEGMTFALSSSTTAVYNDIDKVMLGHYGMEAANGIYGLAYRCLNVFIMPMTAVYGAAFPRFFQHGAKGIRNTFPLARRLLVRTSGVGVLVAIAIYFGAPLAGVIVGRGFSESALALRWLCLIPLFRSFQWCAGDILAGSGLQRFRFYSQLTAAGFNFSVNLYLIPHFSWRGAAFSSLLTDAGLAALNWVMVFCMVGRPVASEPSHTSAL